MTLDDRQCWFNVAVTDGLGPASAQKILKYLDRRELPASALADMEAEQLQFAIGLKAGVAVKLQIQLRSPVAAPDAPEGVELLVPCDDRFPIDRFRDANPPLPPLLWASADTALLRHGGPALAVAGARDTTDSVLDLVHDIGRTASRRDWLIVSGLAQGVDSAAHTGALAGPTGTIGVLACGIANTSRSWMPDDTEAMCIVSQFGLHEPWSGPRAMQRNSVIAGLADRVLVAAAGTSGGSWEMAQLCLKRRKTLFVLDLEPEVAPGNRALIRAGAIPVDPLDLERLFAELDEPTTLFD